MRIVRNLVVALMALGLSACAVKPITPIKMDTNFYQDNTTTVGVYFVTPEKVDTYLDGASCLLCYAVAATANNLLTQHMQTMSVSDFSDVKHEIVGMLSEKGKNVNLLESDLKIGKLKSFKPKTPGFADRDFTPLKAQAGVDKLLIVQIDVLGAQRSYSGYVPTSSPAGAVYGTMYMVDLTTNKLELYQPIREYVAVSGEWDEPSAFPGVTNAYFEAVEKAKTSIKQQL